MRTAFSVSLVALVLAFSSTAFAGTTAAAATHGRIGGGLLLVLFVLARIGTCTCRRGSVER